MRLVQQYLPRAYHDGGDIEARAHMMAAAMMGATGFQKGLGAIHAISHPVGAVHGTHHGTTNAVCMPAVLAFNRPEIETRFDAVAAYLDITGGYQGFCDYVVQLNEQFKIPKTLTALGVENPDVDSLTKSALEDPSVGGNPVAMNYANTRALIEGLL